MEFQKNEGPLSVTFNSKDGTFLLQKIDAYFVDEMALSAQEAIFLRDFLTEVIATTQFSSNPPSDQL